MTKTINKLDRNILTLHDILDAMTNFSYNEDIEKKLKDFIFYLEDFYLKLDLNNDIIDDELIRIITFEDNNANL